MGAGIPEKGRMIRRLAIPFPDHITLLRLKRGEVVCALGEKISVLGEERLETA